MCHKINKSVVIMCFCNNANRQRKVQHDLVSGKSIFMTTIQPLQFPYSELFKEQTCYTTNKYTMVSVGMSKTKKGANHSMFFRVHFAGAKVQQRETTTTKKRDSRNCERCICKRNVVCECFTLQQQ